MGVRLYNIPKYQCICDQCKAIVSVDKAPSIYNGAQAVRSIGWSFGKDGRVLCKKCRQQNFEDKYKWGR